MVQCFSIVKQFLHNKDRDSEANKPVTKVITVPHDNIGRMIGRGGNVIKQIQDLTGACSPTFTQH